MRFRYGVLLLISAGCLSASTLDSSTFDAFFTTQGENIDWHWTEVDHNSAGWSIGTVWAEFGLWDTSYVWSAQDGMICCNADMLHLTDITESGLIVGAWYQGVYGTVDQFRGRRMPLFDWSGVTDPAFANAAADPWGYENVFLAVSEDGQRIQTAAGLLDLTPEAPLYEYRTTADTPEPGAWVLLLSGLVALVTYRARAAN